MSRLLFFTLFIFSCKSAQINPMQMTSSLHDIYILTHVKGEGIKGKLNKQATLEINLTTQRVIGNEGCNNFSGNIMAHKPESKQIQFSEMFATEMYCNELSNTIGQFLLLVRTYDKKELALIFYNEEGVEILRYQKVD